MRDNKRPPHRGDPLPQQIRQSPEKLYRSRNPQPTPLRHSLSEVLCVVRQQPIRLRLHRGEQHRHIRRMANQPSTSNHRVQLRKRDHLRPGQFNESAIVLNDAWTSRFSSTSSRTASASTSLQTLAAQSDSTALSSPHGATMPPVNTLESRNSRSLRVTSSSAATQLPKPLTGPERRCHSDAERLAPAPAEASPSRRPN